MKRLLVMLMILMSLLIGFQQAIIVVNFQFNRAAITAQYCVNKDSPERHCFARCYLEKRVKESREAEAERICQKLRVDILGFPVFVIIGQEIFHQVVIMHRVPYKHKRYTAPNRTIFKPPPQMVLLYLYSDFVRRINTI